VWLCEELGLDYEFKRYDRRADNRLAPDEYKALHPMGIAPVITERRAGAGGERRDLRLYLRALWRWVGSAPRPDDLTRRPSVSGSTGSNGTFMATLMMQLVPVRRGRGQFRRAVRRGPQPARLGDGRGEAGEAPFFGGANLTTADIMMVYCLTTGRAFRGTSLDAYPNLKAYLARIGPASRLPARDGQGRAGHGADAGLDGRLAADL